MQRKVVLENVRWRSWRSSLRSSLSIQFILLLQRKPFGCSFDRVRKEEEFWQVLARYDFNLKQEKRGCCCCWCCCCRDLSRNGCDCVVLRCPRTRKTEIWMCPDAVEEEETVQARQKPLRVFNYRLSMALLPHLPILFTFFPAWCRLSLPQLCSFITIYTNIPLI